MKSSAPLVVSAVTKEDISHRNISEWPQSVNVRAGDLVSVEALHHPAWPPIISDLQRVINSITIMKVFLLDKFMFGK